MKKIVALFMALLMLLGTVALAEPTLLEDFGDENTLVFAREVTYAETDADVDALGNPTNSGKVPTGYAHVTSWAGDWVLVAAYVSEDGIDEFGFEVEPGYYAVAENAVFMNIAPAYDKDASHPNGVMADQAAYLHAHAYDLVGTITYPEDLDEDGFTVKAAFDAWNYTVRGELDADMNFGPVKVSIKGDSDFLYWNEITGLNFDYDEIDEFKYMGMNENGQLIIACTNKNLVTNEKAKIYYCFIFAPVVAEETAEVAE